MKINATNFTTLALLPAVLLAFSSCSSEPRGERTSLTTVRAGEPGGVRVETYQETATVTGIDKAARKVMLETKDGRKTTVTAGTNVANFAQIQVGDQVKATVAEELVVFVRKPGEPSGDGATAVVVLAPIGAQPGAFMANTIEITATVKSIDVKNHKATLLFPDGASHTIKVRADVDLTKRKVGEEVVIRTTEAMAITVEKP